MANVSHLEPLLVSRRERGAGCPGRRYRERERQREGMVMGWGGAEQCWTVQSLLQWKGDWLYVFFRDVKADSGHWWPRQGEHMPFYNVGGGSKSESLYCLLWSWHRECEVLCLGCWPGPTHQEWKTSLPSPYITVLWDPKCYPIHEVSFSDKPMTLNESGYFMYLSLECVIPIYS